MSEKTNTDLMDVLASLKKIVTDEGETPREVAVSGVGGKLILAPSQRLTDDASDYEIRIEEMLKAKISLLEEMIKDKVDLWERVSVGRDGYAGSAVRVAPLEEIADAALGEPSGYVSDVTDEDYSIKNEVEAVDRGENDIEDASVPPLSVDLEKLRPMVADIIRTELRGVLGQKITANIRSMVRREIEIAIDKLIWDPPD